jgi:hypothetical protein
VQFVRESLSNQTISIYHKVECFKGLVSARCAERLTGAGPGLCPRLGGVQGLVGPKHGRGRGGRMVVVVVGRGVVGGVEPVARAGAHFARGTSAVVVGVVHVLVVRRRRVVGVGVMRGRGGR